MKVVKVSNTTFTRTPECSLTFQRESRLIVGTQLEALAGQQGAFDVIYIPGCGDITKRDVSGW